MDIKILETLHEKTRKWLVFHNTELLFTANTPLEAFEWICQNKGLPIQTRVYI